jgi:uncharacterized repeat protein (TIGR03803 family)
MNRLKAWKAACAALLLCAMGAVAASAQTFTSLVSFDGTDAANPAAPVVQGTDGNFYGTTSNGGKSSAGTVFKMTPDGTLTTLYTFCIQSGCPDGQNPSAALIQGADGNFYGTTNSGGAHNTICPCGTIFRITPDGTLTTMYRFLGNTGNVPSQLVQGSDGNFYGTTVDGGAGSSCPGSQCGTVFRITPAGAFLRLYSFCSQPNCTDGANPSGGLIQGADGDFYGTTQGGGENTEFCSGCGTVFRITRNGTVTTLHRFSGIDGFDPVGALVQGSNGILYGTTALGGANLCPNAVGCGTVFQITTSGKLTTLHKFNGSPEGQWPFGALVQGTDENFYGTNSQGGTDICNMSNRTCGTVFRMTPSGKLTIPYSFCAQLACVDGLFPEAGLIQGTDGSFYGTTVFGGDLDGSVGGPCAGGGCGTVFQLTLGLKPFVTARPSAGIVGTNITILGNGLTGSTVVSFNSTAAAFIVVSDSEITATVPTGATTGAINVTAPGGPLASNVAFKVTPQVLSFLPTSGAVGTSVVITGESLTGASAVSFGSLSASFTVNSDTQITATVPTGAVTGDIAARTTGGRGQSTTAFTVTP